MIFPNTDPALTSESYDTTGTGTLLVSCQEALVLLARTLRVNIRSVLDDISRSYNCDTIRPAFVAVRDSFCCTFGYVLVAESSFKLPALYPGNTQLLVRTT